jgi:hypothetical protein
MAWAGGSDVDEKLASVLGMRESSDQAALLEVVEQRRHRSRRHHESFSDDTRLQWFAGAFDDGEYTAGAG